MIKVFRMFDDLHKENIDEVEFGMDTDLLREIGSLDDSFDEDYDNSKFAIKGCLRGGLFNYVFDLPNVCKLICDEIKLVNLDKIINTDTKAILSTVSDKAIKETFALLGKDKLDYIETEINQFASQKLLQSLFLISELDISNNEVKKKELITKIIPYLQK